MLEFTIVAGIILIIWAVLRQRTWQRPTTKTFGTRTLNAYQVRESLFVNTPEQALFTALVRHVPQGWHVFSKVRLEDVLSVKTSVHEPRLRWQYRGRIKSRHVDFLLCHNNGQFICAVELDGCAHMSAEARQNDLFKDEIFKRAGLPLLRVKTGEDFDHFARHFKSWKND
jgi:hypothetical protein